MTLALIAATTLALLVWLYLVVGHGGFWRADQRLTDTGRTPPPTSWPAVAVVVPARNEASVIEHSLRALLTQDYPGRMLVVLVDDHSEDQTRAIAQQVGNRKDLGNRNNGGAERLAVIGARSLPPGWSGKLWAVAEGVRYAGKQLPETRYFLLTDADILHDPASLRRLVQKAQEERLDLVSLMVQLDHRGFWAGLLIPAFVFFFQKLYPFPWVNSPRHAVAAAAGGCVLIRRQALDAIGGIARISGALIDDCALAAAIKADPGTGVRGRLWLGLTSTVISLRPYSRFGDIWDMVVRTAYTQLNHSPLLLAGTILGMIVTYLVAPLVALSWPLHQVDSAALFGAATWLLMTAAFRPTLRLYGKPTVAALLLPLAGFLYSLMTVASAIRHWRGQGGRWKGRTYQGSRETGLGMTPAPALSGSTARRGPASTRAPGRAE